MILRRLVVVFGLVPLASPISAKATAGQAPKTSPPRLVSFDQLQAMLGSPNLRLLDTRPAADFEKGHIPGSIRVDVKQAESLAARPGGLTDQAAWESWIAPLGIGPETVVLVLDGGRQLDAARVWWLLRYLGVETVGLVNGNLALWAKEGRPWTTDLATVAPQAMSVRFRTDRLATRADVLELLNTGKGHVVDARTQAEHTGERALSKRGGRIPNSCHLEWTDFVDADGRFRDESALRERIAKAGLPPGEPVVTHCQGGGRASVNAFILERLGFPTRNYYLGWSDWGTPRRLPVQTGPPPSR